MNRFTTGTDWRSWIIGFAWDSRQAIVALGPFTVVYWRSKYRKEQNAAIEERKNAPPVKVSGGRSARRRRRR